MHQVFVRTPVGMLFVALLAAPGLVAQDELPPEGTEQVFRLPGVEEPKPDRPARKPLEEPAQPYGMVPLGEQAYNAVVRFYDYDRRRPLNPRIVDTRTDERYIREKIVFDGALGARTVGYLALPRIRRPPFRCVLLLHDLAGEKEDWWDIDSYPRGGQITNMLLAAGHAVFMLDAEFHGERIGDNDFEPPRVMTLQNGEWNRFRHVIVQTVTDYRRGLDYLETRSEIHGGKIGALGYGMGGLMTFALAAVDHRVTTAVACATPIFKDALAVYAPYHYCRALDECAFLLIMAREDDLYSISEAERLASLLPGKNKNIVFFDGDHRLPRAYTAEAVRWLKLYLR